jgi:hypothetical protein
MRHSLNGDREWVHAVIETFFPAGRATQSASPKADEGQRGSENPDNRERDA